MRKYPIKPALVALTMALLAGAAHAQKDGRSSDFDYFGDPGEGFFGNPGEGNFGVPPKPEDDRGKPVTVRPLRPFDSQYLKALPDDDETRES